MNKVFKGSEINEFTMAIAIQAKPLLNLLHANYFAFRRFSKTTNKQIVVCTEPKWLDVYFNNSYYNKPEIIKAAQNNNGIYPIIWELLPNISDQSKTPLEHAKKFNFYHSASIIKAEQDHFELFSFAASKENPEINSNYLLKFGQIMEFIASFTNNAALLLAALPKIECNNLNLENNNVDKNFNKSIAIKKIAVRTKINREIYLTPRESQCLLGIVSGKTSKEISLRLNLNYRVVEFYIANIKKKTGYRSKSELIAMFYDSSLGKGYRKYGLQNMEQIIT